MTGSVVFIAQARAAWAVVEDSGKPGRRLLLKLKNNLAKADVPGLAFTIREDEQGHACLEWEPEPVTLNIHEVMGGFSNASQPRGPKPDKMERAKVLIREMLADGRELRASDVEAAAHAARISTRTLSDAANGLGVRKRTDGFRGPSIWALDIEINLDKGERDDSAGLAYPRLSEENSAPLGNPAPDKGFLKNENSAALQSGRVFTSSEDPAVGEDRRRF